MNIQSTTNIQNTTSDLNSFGIPTNGDIEEVAQSFESLIASQLVKEMRKTLSDGLFGSEQSEVLGGMFDLHMGQALAEGGGLGIKDLVAEHWQTSFPTEGDKEVGL